MIHSVRRHAAELDAPTSFTRAQVAAMPKNEFAGLFAVALHESLRSYGASAISRTFRHSSSLTGDTDSRDRRISSIFARAGSALICFSVTGPSFRTGSTATETQFGS